MAGCSNAEPLISQNFPFCLCNFLASKNFILIIKIKAFDKSTSTVIDWRFITCDFIFYVLSEDFYITCNQS